MQPRQLGLFSAHSLCNQYIIDFNEAAEASASREEFVEKMLAVHGDRGNVSTLWNSVTAFFRALGQQSRTAGAVQRR